ncbi:MAG: serine/threonine protein kinase [Limisphaerales bacterium]
MDTIRLCRHCGAALPSDPPGARCVECGGQSDTIGPADSQDEALAPPSPAELAPSFPGLEILEVAGQGGMGTIYKARQPQLDRLVALKILSPALGRDPAFAEHFSREAQALAKLNHSNIVSVFDFGRAGSYYYFLMEYVDGVTLRALMNQRAISPEEAQRIVIEICHALQYAHEEGIVHRDFKPSNIILDKKGRVKIADFGLARLLSKNAKEPSGGGHLFMGTPVYMPPEQMERPWKVDRRADIYALGVMLYEMLTGELPIGHFQPPSHKAGVDPSLDKVVLRALGKQPWRRYQNANEVRAAVETATGRFHNLPGDLPRHSASRKWKWLPRFALVAGTVWLSIVSIILMKGHWSDERSVLISAGALEAFAAGSEGADVGRRVVQKLNLNKEQVQSLNTIMWRYQREFTALERHHTERSKNADGHVVLTISPFPQEMDALMERLWKDLGTILSAGQLETAKTLNFEKIFPHTGKKPFAVEIWQDENGEVHYVEGEGPAGKNARRTGIPPTRFGGWFWRDSAKTNH